MPEQEIRTEDPTSWPQGSLEILDFTGATKLATMPLGDMKDPYLLKYETLRVEITLLYTKIVENGTDEYLFPVYSPPGSSIDERHLAAAERHQILLGEYTTGTDGDFNDVCFENFRHTFNFLREQHHLLSSADKAKMRTHIESLRRGLSKFVRILETEQDNFPDYVKPLSPNLVNNLESDIRKWLDDEGPFPRYISVNAILDSWKYLTETLHDYEPSGESIFDALGIFNPERFSMKILEKISFGGTLRTMPSLPAASFETKNFMVVSEGGVFQISDKRCGTDHNSFVLPDFMSVENSRRYVGEVCLLQQSDAILCHDYAKGRWVFYIVDLDLASKQKTDSKGIPAHSPVWCVPKLDLCKWRELYCSPQGILIIEINEMNAVELKVHMYPLTAGNPYQVQAWAVLDFKVLPDAVNADKTFEIARSVISKTEAQQIYLASVTRDQFSYIRGMWFCRLDVNRTSASLRLRCQQVIPLTGTTLESLDCLWLEDKKHRVFACAFTPDCRLWAFMYWKGKFVSTGRRGNNPHHMSSILSEIDYIRDCHGSVGLLGWRYASGLGGADNRRRFAVYRIVME